MVKYEKSEKYTGVRRRIGQPTWNARYSVKFPDSPAISGELTGFKTEKEAFEARTLKIAEIKKNGKDDKKYIPRKLFSEVYEEYYKSCIDKAVGTLKKYDSMYRQHLKPAFGNKYIDSITIADIETFFKEKGDNIYEKKYNKLTCYSQEYLHCFRKLLQNVFTYAKKKEYLLKDSPMLYISKDIYSKMGRDKEEGQYITRNQMAIILESLRNSALQPSVMIAYHTGMRLGEVFGLLWSDIDLENRVIDVNKQMINFNGVWCFAKPKTPAAFRKIAISEQLVAYLTALKIKQGQEQYKYGDRYARNYVGLMKNNHEYDKLDENLPFVNRKANGTMLTPSSFKSASIIINKLNFPFRVSFHDFRHTNLTNLIKAGISADVLKRRAGHEKITTTLDIYKRVTEEDTDREYGIVNMIDLPAFEDVKDEIERLNTYLESWQEDTTDIPEEPTTYELLGGQFNRKGFLYDNKGKVS